MRGKTERYHVHKNAARELEIILRSPSPPNDIDKLD